MAVAFVAGGTAFYSSGGGTSITTSITVGSGSDRFFLCQLDVAAGSVSGVSYAAVALSSAGTNGSQTMWQLVAPATGANNRVISCAASTSIGESYSDWSGVDQTTPLGTVAVGSATSTSPATASITVPAGGAAYGGYRSGYTSSGTTTTATGATTLVGGFRNGSNGRLKAGGYITGTGALTWSFTGANRSWEAQGFPINPSGGGGTTVLPNAGSITFTGYAPTITATANQDLSPAQGAVAITGYAPAITQGSGTAVSPDVGSIAISGYAPSVSQSALRNIFPDAGALAITGYAPTISQAGPQGILPGVGTITITGYSPTVAQSGDGFADTHDGFWRKKWEAARKKRIEPPESISHEIQEVVMEIISKPRSKYNKLSRPEIERIVSALVADEVDEDDIEVLLLVS